MYLRKKKVRNVEYLYLVKSEWDKVKKISKQKTIKYLGDSNTVNRDDIPVEYRDDPKINAYLIENTPTDFKRKEAMINKFQEQLFSSLTEGELKNAIQLYESFVGQSTIEKFYEKIMTPVMKKIGSMWSAGKLSIATEHMASNAAQSLVKIISDNHKRNKLDKGKLIITTPVGEDHCLSCNVLESFLLSKGFTTFNLSPSTPAESLIQFIKTVNPSAILISITLEENIKSGQRLTKKIHNAYKKLPIFIGGQAFLNNTRLKFDAILIENTRQLEQIPRILTKKQY